MTRTLLAPLTLLLAIGCSPAAEKTTAPTDAANAADSNVRADGSIIDESKPHEHTEANAHPKADMAMSMPAPGDSEATRGSKAAMMKMMEGMPPYTGDADVDFNKQMRGHHQAAVEMAEVELASGKDAESRALATKIIADQKREIAQIDVWLAKRGQQ